MKKLLAITLCLCMVFSTIMMVPASAATINGNVATTTKGATTSAVGTSYNVANAIDGNDATIAATDGFGNAIVIDLGADYDVTSVEIKYPSEAEITTATAGISGIEAATAFNSSTQIRIGATAPSTAAASATSYGTRINPESTNVGKGVTKSYTTGLTGTDKYRYLVITQGASSNPTAVSEVKVYADYEPSNTVTTNKYITPVGFSWGGSDPNSYVTGTNNIPQNMLDNDPSTMYISDQAACYVFIDLGAEYDLTQVELTVPTQAQLEAFIAANNIKTNSNEAISAYNAAMHVRAADANKTLLASRVNSDAMNVGLGKTKIYTEATNSGTNSLAGTTKIRYIMLTTGASANPIVVSEIKIKGYVTEEIAPEVAIASEKVQYGVSATNYAPGKTVVMTGTKSSNTVFAGKTGYAGAQMVDGDESTFGYLKVQYGSVPGSDHMAVIDLGEAKDIDSLAISVPTIEQITAATTYTDTTNYPISNVNKLAVVALTNTYPTMQDFTDHTDFSKYAGVDGIQLNDNTAASQNIQSGFKWKNVTGETQSYRYVAIYSPYTWGAAINEVKVYSPADGGAKMRFFFNATHNAAAVDSFGAYIIPFDLLATDESASDNLESVLVNNTTDASLLTTGTSYAVDLDGIPEAAFGKTIVALPFVSINGQFYYGTAATSSVNAVRVPQQ